MSALQNRLRSGRWLAAAVLINTILSLVAFWAIERAWGASYSFLDAIYWAGITAPTVGYGDILPTLAASKIVTLWLVLTSWAAFGVGISLLTNWLIANPFEAEVLDDADDTITMLCLLLEHHGIEIPDSVEEYHGKPTHYTATNGGTE